MGCSTHSSKATREQTMWRWYLIYTKPLEEVIAITHLERQEYEIYFPRLAQITFRRGRRQEHIGPLFPRYLFLHLDEGRQSLKPVHSTRGVVTVVRFGSRYAIVPDEMISSLRARADESGLHRIDSCPSLAPGMATHVVEGPFQGLEGVFEREEGRERVLILLNLLGQEVHVQLPACAVASVNAGLRWTSREADARK